MSKKHWPIFYSKLLYKTGHYFLDIQYDCSALSEADNGQAPHQLQVMEFKSGKVIES